MYLCANNVLKVLENQLNDGNIHKEFHLDRLIEFLKVYPIDLMVGIMRILKLIIQQYMRKRLKMKSLLKAILNLTA